MRRKHIISAVVIISVVVFNLLGTTLFVHDHNLGDIHISHSHPYSGDPENHSHSDGTLLLIWSLANPDMAVAEVVMLDEPLLSQYAIASIRSIEAVATDLYLHYSLRAPPVR